MGGRSRLVVFVTVLTTFAVVVQSCGARADDPQSPPVGFPLLPSTTDAPDGVSSAAVADAVAERASTTPASTSSATFAFTGDNLTHSPIVDAARTAAGYDFTPMFAEIAPVIATADVAVCHLETPVAPPGQALSTYPLYGVPAAVATSLAAVGYDRCSTASNHVMDRGVAGIDATVDALEAAGIGQSGMARTADEDIPALFTVNGMVVAHLSFTFGTNGLRVPAAEPWRTNLLSADAVIDAAREARARGAQVVIASLHWGVEGSNVVTAEQRAIAEAVTASGLVDLIVGHHAHVVEPIELINGHWVVFGLGNILSNLPTNSSWPASTQDGMIVTLTISRSSAGVVQVERPVVTPTWVDKGAGWTIRLVQRDLDEPALPAGTRRALAASLARTAAVVGEYLAASSPLS